MIRLEQNTKDQPDYGGSFPGYDDVVVQISGGFEMATEEWIRIIVGFLMQVGFYHGQIVSAMKGYVELAEEE